MALSLFQFFGTFFMVECIFTFDFINVLDIKQCTLALMKGLQDQISICEVSIGSNGTEYHYVFTC